MIGEDGAREFCKFYDVTASGNFEGKSIFNIPNAEEPEWRSNFERAQELLFREREKRIKPHRDEKVLTAWNGLMLAAFAEAGAILDLPRYREIAVRNAEFILTQLAADGRLLRTWKNGRAKLNGYLEDYANVADGLLVLFQATGEFRYLTESQRLADLMITEFWDEEGGGFFFTSNDHEELIVRNKDFYDNATPSGNSVGADVLLRLAKITGEEKYERFAVATLRLAASQIRRHPQGFGRALSALQFHLSPTKEVVLVGGGEELTRAVDESYLPFAVIVRSSVPNDTLPLLAKRGLLHGKPTAYVCQEYVCERPVTSSEDLGPLLSAEK